MHGSKHVFQRLGPSSQQQEDTNNNSNKNNAQKVCIYWRAGRCNRFPCHFPHTELPGPPPHQQYGNNNNSNSGISSSSSKMPNGVGIVKKTDKVCNYWVKGNCKYGNTCWYLHAWTTGDCFTLLSQLEGHEKVVTGIALPPGSNKLYTASKDKTIRVWDCQSGQFAKAVNFDGEVGCMLSEGPWIFVGITNLVKAWNTQTGTDFSLHGPVGQVYALVAGNDMLFAGTEDGILVWKYNGSTNNFDPFTVLTGHTHHVVSLVIGDNRLYSGSMDNSIRVWNLETFQCLLILTDHTSVVMSVLCWDQFLLSCSLDKTIKVWAANESGKLEVTYTHQEERGLLALCVTHDSEAKPVLLCSCNDNTIRVYDLPSFSERGKIFSKEGVRRIGIGPAGLFFTGDESGQVRVWKWLTESSSSTS